MATTEQSGRRFRDLTLKQERFVLAYVGEAKGNGTEAARQAGYSDPEVSAFNNKQNQAVRARIDELLRAEALTAAEVLAELTAVAKSPTDHFMQVVMPADDETGREMIVRLDYGAKIKSLELLGKYHALFTDKQEINAKVTQVREYVDGDH
jgi:phage terminase small subunit